MVGVNLHGRSRLMRGMTMTPRTRPVLRAVVAATVVAGMASACAGAGSAVGSSGVGSPSSTTAPSSTSTSSPSASTDLRATAPDGSAVPDGTWTRTATLADATALDGWPGAPGEGREASSSRLTLAPREASRPPHARHLGGEAAGSRFT